MPFKFETLKVWEVSLNLSNEIDLLAKKFPKIEWFSLSKQIKKAADSVNLNIAEGCIGQSNVEFKRFLTYSLRSAFEVVSCMFLALKRSYISDSEFGKFYKEYDELCRMISKLRSSLS